MAERLQTAGWRLEGDYIYHVAPPPCPRAALWQTGPAGGAKHHQSCPAERTSPSVNRCVFVCVCVCVCVGVPGARCHLERYPGQGRGRFSWRCLMRQITPGTMERKRWGRGDDRPMSGSVVSVPVPRDGQQSPWLPPPLRPHFLLLFVTVLLFSNFGDAFIQRDFNRVISDRVGV